MNNNECKRCKRFMLDKITCPCDKRWLSPAFCSWKDLGASNPRFTGTRVNSDVWVKKNR